MYRRSVILFLIILFTSANLLAQKDFNNYQADTSRVNILIEKSRGLLFVYPDSSKLYLDTIGEISHRINYKTGLYNYYNLNGIIYGMYGEQDAAVISYKKGLVNIDFEQFPRQKAILLMNIGLEYWRIFELDSASYYYEEGNKIIDEYDVEDLKAKLLFDLGNILIDKENFVDASKKLFDAKEMLTQAKDTMLLTYLYGSIGVLYTKVGDFEKALKSYHKALDYDLVYPNINNLSNTYNNIGQLYFNHNISYDSAIYYYRKSVEVALPHMKQDIETVSNINTGNVFIERKLYDTAYYYYAKAYADSSIINYPEKHAAILINIGVYYRYKLDFIKARNFLERGIVISDSFNLLTFKATGLEKLYEIDSIESNDARMIKHLRELYKTRDSIYLGSDRQKIASLEFEKYLAKEKYDNDILQKENELNTKLISNQKILLWVFLIALAFMLFAITRLISRRKKIRRLLSQLSDKNDELKLANEELSSINDTLNSQSKKLNELILTKDKFFSIIGHDLKSPFNVLLGLLQLMDQEWDDIDDNDKHSHIHALYNSSVSTYELLEDILLWGRAQQGLLESKSEKFKIYPEIVGIKKLFVLQLEEKEITFTTEIQDDFELNTDVRYFCHIIQNLLNNAIKFTNRGGDIIIKASSKGTEKSICVVDNGIGIPKSKVNTIFNIDSDFGRQGTEKEKSTGMGLILSMEYANLIGAKLTVESTEQDIENNKRGRSSFCLIFN